MDFKTKYYKYKKKYLELKYGGGETKIVTRIKELQKDFLTNPIKTANKYLPKIREYTTKINDDSLLKYYEENIKYLHQTGGSGWVPIDDIPDPDDPIGKVIWGLMGVVSIYLYVSISSGGVI